MQDTDGIDELQRRWWHDPRVAAGAAATIALLVVAVAWLGVRLDIAEDRRALLEARAAQGFLQAPSSSRTVRLDLASAPTVGIGGGEFPERVELVVAARSNRFNLFRVAIGRDDGIELLQFDRLQRDSNGDLKWVVNTSLLPPGRYTVRVEGITWRGEVEPFGRFALRR